VTPSHQLQRTRSGALRPPARAAELRRLELTRMAIWSPLEGPLLTPAPGAALTFAAFALLRALRVPSWLRSLTPLDPRRWAPPVGPESPAADPRRTA
jgi:hypothetical protein